MSRRKVTAGVEIHDRRQLAPSRKARGARTPRRARAFLAALRRQCRLANEADRRDNWQQYIHLPE